MWVEHPRNLEAYNGWQVYRTIEVVMTNPEWLNQIQVILRTEQSFSLTAFIVFVSASLEIFKCGLENTRGTNSEI